MKIDNSRREFKDKRYQAKVCENRLKLKVSLK